MRYLKKLGMGLFHAVASGKNVALAFLLGIFALVGSSAHAAVDIVTYDGATGTITWDFSSILTMLFTALGAAIGAGVLIWVAIKGYGMMKKFLGR